MPRPVKTLPKAKTPTRAATGWRSRITAFPETEELKILDYGRSGTGKTRLWSTFPGPILVIVCSGGNMNGELRSINTAEIREKVTPVTLESTEQIKEITDEQRNTSEFATIVLDHASGLQDHVMREILGLKELPAQMGWGDATQQQWGKAALQMKELLRALIGCPGHTFIAAQEREFKGTEEGDGSPIVPYIGAGLSPSVTGWLNPACDYIVQSFIRRKTVQQTTKLAGKPVTRSVVTNDVEFCIRTGPDPIYQTKFRVPPGKELPDVIVDPSYDRLREVLSE